MTKTISMVLKRLVAIRFQGNLSSVSNKTFLTKYVMNLIQVIIERSYEHLNTCKIYIPIQRFIQKLRFVLFCNIFCETSRPYLYKGKYYRHS